MPPLGGAILGGHQADKRTRAGGLAAKARRIIEHRLEGQRDDRPHPRRGHQVLRNGIGGRPRGDLGVSEVHQAIQIP